MSQVCNYKDIICRNCNKNGYFSRKCKVPKKKSQQREDDSVNSSSGDLDDVLICCIDSPVKSWILDSATSFHFTPCKELLNNYVAGNHGNVCLAGNEPLEILGKGEVNLKTMNGTQWNCRM